MQIYDITILANQSRQLDAPGTYFYYYAGSAGGADATIVLRESTHGTTITLKPGQAYRLPKGMQAATRWDIRNYANAGTIIGNVVVGEGEITDNRVTGEVAVIDGGYARSIANLAFCSSVAVSPVTTTNVGGLMLWNNAAAGGKSLIVEFLNISANVAETVNIFLTGATLTTLVAAATPKSAGGVVSTIAQLKTQENVGGSGFGVAEFPLIANTNIQWIPREPIVLTPQTGILVRDNSMVGHRTQCTFEHYEQ